MNTYQPVVGGSLVVDMPGERLPAIVQDVVSDDVVIVEIAAQPLIRGTHFYKLGDVLWCKRSRSVLGDKWEVTEQRPHIATPPKPRAKPKAKPKAKKNVRNQ
jgi:hypothetical protein